MEAIINFSVIKEKIIKTDELLRLYEDKSAKLVKANRAYKEAKIRYENTSLEVNRLKMDNERAVFNLDKLTPKYNQYEKEVITLREDYAKLEEKYAQTLIESQLSYRALQDQFSHCTCDKESTSKKRRSSMDVKHEDKIKELSDKCKQLEQIDQDIRKDNSVLILKNKELLSDLTNERKKYGSTICELKTKNNLLEMDLEASKEKIEKMKLKVEQTNSLQLELASLEHEKNFEVGKLKNEIRRISTDTIQKYRQDSKVDEDIASLRRKCELLENQLKLLTGISKVDCEVQTEDISEEDWLEDKVGSIHKIFSEMIVPRALSPFSNQSVMSEDLPLYYPEPFENIVEEPIERVEIPQIIITPPTPTVEKPINNFEMSSNVTDCAVQTEPINFNDEVNKKPPINKANKLVQKRKFCTIYNNNVIKSRKLKKQKECHQEDIILKAMQTLQQKNINFTISNESLLNINVKKPDHEPSYLFYDETLCWNKNCNKDKSYMLLSHLPGQQPELLGFTNVKKEINKSSKEIIKPCLLEPFMKEFLVGIKSLLSESKKRYRYSKTKHEISDFRSETETEIERLFRKPSNILKRNRMLLKAAQENRDSNLETDSGILTGTPITVLSPLESEKSKSRVDLEYNEAYDSCVYMDHTYSLSPLRKSDKAKSNDIGRKRKNSHSDSPFRKKIARTSGPVTNKNDKGQKFISKKFISDYGSSDEGKIKVEQNPVPKVTQQYLFGSDISSSENECDPPEKSPKLTQTVKQKRNVLRKWKIKQNSPIEAQVNCDSFETKKAEVRNTVKKLDINIVSNSSSDIMSSIIEDMLKTRPKPKPAFSSAKEHVSINPVPSILTKLENSGTTNEETKSTDKKKSTKLSPDKVSSLFNKLMVYSKEDKMLDRIVTQLESQEARYISELMVEKLSLDFREKAENLFPPAPALTQTQRVMLGLLGRLNRSTHPSIYDTFLSVAEMELYNRHKCELQMIAPITRVYAAVCKLRRDLNRIRRFCCDGFYFMGDFAIPMFFIVLTVWAEVLPVESQCAEYLLAKVLVQICHLKDCNLPGYNLLPLRDLLHRFFGYPVERWKCDDIFQDILVEYLRNPALRISDYTLLLFLKNKPTKWVYQKIKQNIMPLLEKVPKENSNLKATLIILLGNICHCFQKYEEYDWTVIQEMQEWFTSLDNETLPPLLKRSIYLAISRLPRRPANAKKRIVVEPNPTPSNNLETESTEDQK